MKAAVRLDDITPDMDWDSFEAFEALCDRFGVCPLLGVVPQNRDPKLTVGKVREDFWEKIRALQKKAGAWPCTAAIISTGRI